MHHVSVAPLRPALLLLCLGAAWTSSAQQQVVKPPAVQLWMDLSTGTMQGMPEVEVPAGVGNMLGGMLGGAGARAGLGDSTSYGAARGMNMMPPRVLDIALYNSLKPGLEAAQAIPPGMRMGDSLPLIPLKPQPQTQTKRVEREPSEPPEDTEKPKGRILIYWGCGETVRSGQPRVIDFSRGNPADFGAAFAGRFAQDRGARVGPQHALYPNERNRVKLARDSSLVGEHRIQGEGIPASMKFSLGAAQDIMPAIELQSRGQPKDSIALSWKSLPYARAYYLHAMGQAGDDMVMWSSAETGDTGMGLFDYLPNATIERWVKDNVLLKPDTTQCAIPKGIFSQGSNSRKEGGMLRMMAYGGESNFAYPPRPTDPKIPWEPEWAVRVRVKANTMAMLGEDQGRQTTAAPSAQGTAAAPPAPPPAPANPVQGAIESVLPIPSPANLLKGLFGR